MTTSRRGRAMRVLARGAAAGLALALLRVDAHRFIPERAAVLNGTPVAVGGVGGRALSGGVDVSALEATVSERVAEILREREETTNFAETGDGDEATMVNDETLSHEPEVVVDAVKKEARDSASEARKTEKKSATNRRDEEPDRAEILKRNPAAATTTTVSRDFLDPFELRAVYVDRPDAFAVEDARENRCAPREMNTTIWGSPRQLDYIVPLASEDWPRNCKGREALCDVLKRVAQNREVLAAVANSQAPGLEPFLDMLISLKVPNFLIIALDEPLTRRLDDLGVAYYFHEDSVSGNHKVSAKKFALIQEFVSVGCSVLLTDTDVTYQQNPFSYLYRDSDIESMSDGFDNDSANGFLQPIDDVAFGAARRRASSFRVGALNSGMWYVSATEASLRLMKIMAHRMATEDLWDQSGYNLELWFASRDDHMTSGATVRIMNPFCFMNSKVMFRIIRHEEALQKAKHRPVAMHANYHTDKDNKIKLVHAYYAEDAPLSSLDCTVGCDSNLKSINQLESEHLHSINDGFIGNKYWKAGMQGLNTCKPMTAWDGQIDGLERKLHLIQENERVCAKTSLKATARKICKAVNDGLELGKDGDVFLIVADADDKDTFTLLIEAGIAKNGLTKRTMVVTNDENLAKESEGAGIATVLRASKKSLSKAALKWYAIHSILRDGHGVIFIDPSVVLLSDPSEFFYRDSDLESASDGWDDMSAYGYDHVVDDPSMEWSRFLHGGRVASSDAAFFRLAPTHESVALAERLTTRLTALGTEVSVVQEQDVFNAAVFFPSYGEVVSVGVMRRTLNYLCFANSKTVFLFMRKDLSMADHVPIVIDFSYHVRDLERMRDTYAHYQAIKGGKVNQKAKEAFKKWGAADDKSGTGEDVRALCVAEVNSPKSAEITAHKLASSLVADEEREWSWGGVKSMKFLADGKLSTPWGDGKWALVSTGKGDFMPNALWADFVGVHHFLKFETPEGSDRENTMFISERCNDGSMVVGRALPREAKQKEDEA